MAKGYIAKRTVDALKPGVRDQFLWDDGREAISGFGLKVTPKGKRIFIFQYRVKGKTAPVRMEIGTYGAWTPHEARERAKELRARVELGGDPVAERKADEAAKIASKAARAEAERIAQESSINSISKAFLTSIEGRGGYRFYEPAIRLYVQPAIGELLIADVADADIRRMMGKLDASKAALRRSVFMAARAIWKFNRDERENGRGFPSGDPFAEVRSPKPVSSRSRVLTDREIRAFWAALESEPYPYGDFYRLLFLTAARRDEVAAMDWSELSREDAVWRLPESRTKNGQPHEVPLSPAVLNILDALARTKNPQTDNTTRWPAKGIVLPSREDTPISGFSKAKLRLDAAMVKALSDSDEEVAKLEPWRVHDLRRTVATRLQALNVRFEVTEAILNHVSGSRAGVAGIYQRHGWTSEKRAALAAWADQLQMIIS